MLLHQTRYLSDMLLNYGVQDCKPVSTPQVIGSILAINNDEPIDKQKYQAIIGSLTYALTTTRPNFVHILGSINQFNSNPGGESSQSVKRILRYVAKACSLKRHQHHS